MTVLFFLVSVHILSWNPFEILEMLFTILKDTYIAIIAGEDHMVKKIIGSLVLFALVGVAFFQVMNNKEASAGVEEGDKAIDFQLRNLEGKQVSLSDYQGKKVMLNFWATWCPPCKKEMPEMEKVHKENKDIVILSVNLDPNQDVKGFMEKMNLTFPVLLDQENEINKEYKVISIPTSFFIDSEGIIKQKHTGGMTYDQINNAIKEL